MSKACYVNYKNKFNNLIDRILKCRLNNNILWLSLYENLNIMSKEEIEKRKNQRINNNKKVLESIETVLLKGSKKDLKLFKEIMDNDKKINEICYKLLEELT